VRAEGSLWLRVVDSRSDQDGAKPTQLPRRSRYRRDTRVLSSVDSRATDPAHRVGGPPTAPASRRSSGDLLAGGSLCTSQLCSAGARGPAGGTEQGGAALRLASRRTSRFVNAFQAAILVPSALRSGFQSLRHGRGREEEGKSLLAEKIRFHTCWKYLSRFSQHAAQCAYAHRSPWERWGEIRSLTGDPRWVV
jgi:hypothetical protein